MLELVCIICHEQFNETDDVYVTQCGHIFHQSCIRQWLNDSSTCPQCRKTCTSANVHKLYLESAIVSSASGNIGKQAIDMYEEVNLNLKRELEMVTRKFDECQWRSIRLDDERQQVQNDLKAEIIRRENCEKRVVQLERDKLRLTELDQSLQTEYIRVQKDLRAEFKETQKAKEQIAELEKDKFHLKAVVRGLEIQNGQPPNDLERRQNKAKGTTEERVPELVRQMTEEIKHMKRQFERDQCRPRKNVNNPNKHERMVPVSQVVDRTATKIEQRKRQVERDQCRSKNLNNPNQHQERMVLVSNSQVIDRTNDEKDVTAGAILFGIPQLPDEDLKSIFQELCRVIAFTSINLIEINRSGQQKRADSPIVLKFGSSKERNSILKAMSDYSKRLNRQMSPLDLGIICTSTKNIHMREYLTGQSLALLQQAQRLKRSKKLFSVYTNFGSVYVKQSANGTDMKIENEEMLNAIASTSNCQAERREANDVQSIDITSSREETFPRQIAVAECYTENEINKCIIS